jgi:hypothetical protein
MWGSIDGVTYNTGGTYDIVITLHADTAISGTAYMTINGEPQGFYVPNWHPGPADLMPAGITFTGDMTKMQVFYGLYGYGATHSVEFSNVTVNGHLGDNEGPITSNIVASPNPVAVNTQVILTATVDDSTTGDSNIGGAEYSLDEGSNWSSMNPVDGSFDSSIENVIVSFDSFSTAGVYQVLVRGFDSCSDVIGIEQSILIVVYDPEGGFVTGGGWIDSQEGAAAGIEQETFFNGFENNTDGWFEWGGSITRVASGTNGITSASGSWHAEVVVGPTNGDGVFTRFGGYSSTFPAGGFSQLVDVFIDPTMGNIGEGWALDNALNGNDGSWEEAGGVGAIKANDGKWWIAADGDGGGYPGPIGGGVGLGIDTADWYTIESQWIENFDDPTMIDRNTFVYDGVGNLLYSHYNLKQVALADAGGNRYGWFLDSNGPDWPPIQFGLPIDNSALLQFVSPTGRANFGFVSKYKKGATIPTGNTEFIFKAADLNFHSSSYDWLVVTGSNYAKYKGIGTINGDGAYKFMLWAGDGEPDTFRIKIWEEVDEAEYIVYDNGFNQAIEGGNIVIHTNKK